jgi:urease accessory protein
MARRKSAAALKMGRRFAPLINALLREPAIPDGLYYPVAFGLAGARLGIPELAVTEGYLRQSIAGLVSACQRLMPIGQVEASCVIWNLRADIAAAAASEYDIEEITCFTPLPELASARHSLLETRLFIS